MQNKYSKQGEEGRQKYGRKTTKYWEGERKKMGWGTANFGQKNSRKILTEGRKTLGRA
jgi:hypothetical protein